MASPPWIVKKKVVLLLESDRSTADLIQLALNGAGFEVIHTNRSEKVFLLIDKHQPALMLLDLFLPGINGLDLLNDLKKSRKLEDLAVIVISAYGFMEVLQQAILMGAKDFIVKPFNTDLLIEKAQRWSK
jgi:DNA-binding response OmpR family regulator